MPIKTFDGITTQKTKKEKEGLVIGDTMQEGRYDNEPKNKTVRGDVTFIDDGRSVTFFDKTIPAEVAKSQNVKVVTEEEKARRAALTPQQRLEEDKEAGFKRGDYSFFSEEELESRFEKEGVNVNRGKQEEEAKTKTKLQKMAEVGVAVPVALANIISKGVKIISGTDLGEITTEEFASTEVGKTLGMATLAAGAVAAGAAGGYALSLLPSRTVGLSAAGAAKAAVAGAAAKSGIMAKLASSKLILGAIGFGSVGTIISAINGRISDLETSIDTQRETASLIVSAVKEGVLSKSEGILLMQDLEQDILNSEKAIQNTSIFSYKAWLGKGYEAQVRIEKAKMQLIIERQKLLQI